MGRSRWLSVFGLVDWMWRRRQSLRKQRRCRIGVEVLEARVVPSAGDLDPTFGTGGKVLTLINDISKLMDMVRQPDGKIVAAGQANATNQQDFGLARFNPNGTLDTTFGVNGRVVTDFGTREIINGVALQGDGKIVAAGQTGLSTDGWAVARYNADGSLDASFGVGGKVVTDLQPGPDGAYAVAIQSDGKIVVAGQSWPNPTLALARFAVVRYNTDGSLDTSFNGTGFALTDFGPTLAFPNKLLLQPDGKIVALGHSSLSGGNFSFAAARYNVNGSLDTGFGTNGIVKITGGPGTSGFEDIRDAVLLPDGKIVAGGAVESSFPANSEVALIQLTSTGQLDTSFGNGGRVILNFGSEEALEGLALQPDGKLVAVGSSGNDSWVARFTSQGFPDLSFGVSSAGVIITDMDSSGKDGFTSVLLLPDGNILAGGTATGSGQITLARYLGGANPVPQGPDVNLVAPYTLGANTQTTNSSNPTGLVDVNGTIFFAASDGVNGVELWKSDGTVAGTTMVKDIQAGTGSSNPTNLVNVNGTVYFVANDNIKGAELWKSDGTDAGTVLVRDIFAGASGSNPANLTNVGGVLFFTATNGTNGVELWKSDGTTAGTVLVRDIQTGSGSSNPTSLVNVNGVLYFRASNSANGAELWKSDGTSAGTVLVRDLVAGSGSSNPANLTNVGGTLFFSATNNTNGVELWKTDGTSAGTVLVNDIQAGTGSSNPTNFVAMGNTLFFTATNSANGNELWKSDGTTAGTVMVADIVSGSGSSSPSKLTNVNGTLFFIATTPANGIELWKSDGTTAGTVLVKDISAGTGSSNPSNLVALNGAVYFAATTPASGTEIWVSDGTASGTVLLQDINPGSGSSSPASLTAVGETLFVYFSATDPVNGNELWKTDGTAAGTVMVKNVNAIPVGTPVTPLIVASGNYLYYRASDVENGLELWRTDGTPAGTMLVKDISPGPANSNLSNFIDVNGILYFTATDGINGVELWRSDGTEAGTFMVKDILAGTGDSNPGNLTNVNGTLYFTANDGVDGVELWKSDGTAAGTVLVKDIFAGAASSMPASLVNVNGTLYFAADDGVHGVELWKSDGSPLGTVLVKDIFTGSSASNPKSLTNVGGVLYFAANNGGTGSELWKSDGTVAGTILLKDIWSGSSSSNPTNLTAFGNTLVFAANDGNTGNELWKSDGTSAGTALVSNISNGFFDSNPNDFTILGNKLFFIAAASPNDNEVWMTDGTASGTVIVRSIGPGNAGSDPASLTVVNGLLYFSANFPGLGNELWTSDGTAANTIPVSDLVAGSNSSSPTALIAFHNHLYLSATSDVFGLSIWRVNFKPTATADAYSANEDVTLNVAVPGVTSNDSDPDGDPLSAQVVSGAAHGVVNLNSDGSFTYLAASNYSGPDSFSYKVSDGVAYSNTVTVAITVNAVADPPSLSVMNASGSEGSPIPLNINAALVDNDGSESLSILINGVPANVTLSAGINNGNGSWTLTLAQLAGLTLLAPDDAAFTLTIQATATESSNGDAATTTALLSVTVHNVAPVITSLTNSASTLGGTIQGQTVSVSGTFTDAGILDTHTAVINWGDGTTSTGAIIETAGAGSIASNHVYAFGGIYTITVTLTDNSSASDTENTQAIIGGAGVQNGVLNVIGTSQDDQFEINQEDNMLKVHANFFPNDSWISFDLAGVQKIIVLLGSGNDQATVAGNVLTPLLMDGGAGDDFLNAGGGPSILLGGQGDDQLVGSSSRDILIGGVGADHIIGTGSDDILIDGTTTWDANQDALFLLLAEWNRQDLTYVDRIDHLRNGGGLNGSFLFNASTVTHDGFVDVLTGSSGLDWFWANLDANQQPIDSITGQSGDELIN